MHNRWVENKTLVADHVMCPTDPFRHIRVTMISRLLQKEMYGHGIGRHSKEEIVAIGRRDLEALSRFLGDKTYMFGDRISRFDATAFGILCNLVCWYVGLLV